MIFNCQDPPYLMVAAAGETEAAKLANLLVDDVAEPRDEVVGDGDGVMDVRLWLTLDGDEDEIVSLVCFGSGESKSGEGDLLAFNGEDTGI